VNLKDELFSKSKIYVHWDHPAVYPIGKNVSRGYFGGGRKRLQPPGIYQN